MTSLHSPPSTELADPAAHARVRSAHAAFAIAIAFALTTAWTIRDWSLLSLLWLPDNDDMARLAQVRDWLGGQGARDLIQYRFGPPEGGSMHWSRIADVGIALPILLLAPLIGQHQAELVAVIAYPAMLFVAYLLLVVRIACRLGGREAATPALILAALAFPTISLFMPGRIDHHAIQIVFMMAVLDMIVAPPTMRRGVFGGAVVALSLAIGLEAAPEIVAALAVMGIAWVVGGPVDDRRSLGFGISLGGVTALLLLARPDVWPEQWCDGFTPASSRATLVLALGWGLLGIVGQRLSGWRQRSALAAVVGTATLLAAWAMAPVCFAGPYGALDPFLQRVWMDNVSEANSLFEQDTLGTAVSHGALVVIGAVAAFWQMRSDQRWLGFAAFMLIGAVAALLQVRVTYIMAGVGVIPIAAGISNSRFTGARLLLWLIGAGVSWGLVGKAIDAARKDPIVHARSARKNCVSPESLGALAALAPGTVMAPLSLGSYILATTDHRSVSSLYHRNNDGNLAMYRFFLSPPESARAQARMQGISYVALCENDLLEAELRPYRPHSLAERLQSETPPPDWLEEVETGTSLKLYRLR